MRAASVLLIACVLLSGVAGAQPAGVAESRIYGIEIDRDGDDDRVLVFADGPVTPRQLPVNSQRAVLVFSGSRLDPSAPKRIRGTSGSRIVLVNVFERKGATPPEVRVVVQTTPGKPAAMSQRGNVVALTLPSVAGAPAARASRARRPPANRTPSEPTMQARMIGVDVLDAVKRLAAFTEETLLLPDSVRGRVSLDAPKPVTKAEARAMMEALLLLKGFAAVSTPGGIRKIVPITGDIGPWVRTLAEAEGEMLITTLIPLEAIDADLVLQAIQPLVGKSGLAIPHPPSNAIILAGAASRLQRLVDVIRELDRTGPRKFAMLRLEYADATETADTISEVFGDSVVDLDVWPDARTNRIVVRGRPDRVEEVRQFVLRLDRQRAGTGEIQVLPVHYADVDRIAEMLREMQAGGESSARGSGSLAGRDFAMSVHNPTHSLVVQADSATIGVIRDVLAEVDVPPARIDVEVTVAQVTLNEDFEFGLSFLTPLIDADDPDDPIAFLVADPGNTVLPTLANVLANPFAAANSTPLDFIPDGTLRSVITYDPLAVPIIGPGGTPIALAATFGIDASDIGVESRILLRPRLSLLNGEEHRIFAGDNIPIPVSNTAEGGGSLEIRQNVERQDVGVDLRLRPTLTAGSVVDLAIDLEVSNITRSTLSAVAVGTTGVTIQERTLSTRARLRPGRVVVVGWANTPQTSRVVRGTPFLQSIPIFGWLFKRVEERTRSVNLIILARASVHRPETVALTQWMQRSLERQPAEVSLEGAP